MSVENLGLITTPDAAQEHLRNRHGCICAEHADPVAEHDGEHRSCADDLDHVHEPDLPPPPTGPELTEFVEGLDGATSWPEPPAKEGVDKPWGVRSVAAHQLQAGDIIHYADTPATIVEIGEALLRFTIDIRGRTETIEVSWSETVLASRPSGWGDEQAPVAPDLGGLGPSRAEILARIRRPHHDTDDEEADADGR